MVGRFDQGLGDRCGLAPRHLMYRNAGLHSLEADRPLLMVHPKPLHLTRQAITIVSLIDG